jgi:nucleoid DNA-binding protein
VNRIEAETRLMNGVFDEPTIVRTARIGGHPQNGEPIASAEVTLPKFKTGKGLREACNR